jgi:hypothetical protein
MPLLNISGIINNNIIIQVVIYFLSKESEPNYN